MGEGRSISHLLLRSHAPNIFWRFLRHIGTFLDHLRGVDTSMDGALVPKPGQVQQIYWGIGRSISQLLLELHAPNTFCRFLRHIETFPDHMGYVDTPAGRVPVLKTGMG